MALQATFRADTEQFDAALAKAVQSVKIFGQNTALTAGNVARDFQRMTSSFDGSKIYADAAKVVAAVEAIGGASKLTEAEQRKVNATVTEAIAKYKALDQTAPDALRRLAKETAGAEQSMGGLRGAMATALGTFAGFVSAQAVIGGVKAAISGVGSVLSSAFETNASLEKTTLQFTTLMGNADKAKEHVKGLFDFARATPFETQPVIDASKAMQIFGGSALNTKANLTLVGDAAAATGAPINEVATWVGRLYASLKGGQPIGDAAQRLTELGVIGPEARRALENVAGAAGTIETKFKTVQQVLGQFSGAMQLQANTWEGVLSSLSDTINLTLAEAFRGLFETARDTMGRVSTILGDAGVKGALDAVGRAILNAFGSDQQSQVAGMTRAFVAIGQSAAIAAEFAIRAWSLAKAAILGILAAINVENSRVMNTLASMPMIGGQFKEAALQAEGWAKSLADDAKAAWDTAKGNSEIVRSLQTLRTELGRAGAEANKNAMAQASAATATATAGAATKGLAGALDSTASSTKKALSEYDRWVLSLTAGVVATNHQANALAALANAYDIAADARRRGQGLGVELPGTRFGTGVSLAGFVPTDRQAQVAGIANQVSQFGFVPTSNQSTITRRGGVNWGNLLQNVPSQLMNVFANGGGAAQMGGGIGSIAGGVGGAALGGIVSAAATAVGSTMGAALGSAIPVIGTLLGGMAGKFIGGLFGPSKSAIADRDATGRIGQSQAGLLNQFGSLQNIASMNVAGQELAAAWGDRGRAGEANFNAKLAEFNRMTAEQNDLLATQKDTIAQITELEAQRKAAADALVPTWAQVSGLAEKYHIDVAGLGNTVAQLGTTTSFKSLLDDIQTFERAGADAGGMLFGMKEEISKLVQESTRLGTEVPANMRPYIEELAKSGLLLDENGEKITDLSTLKWGAPVETEADQAKASIAKMDETMAKLRETLDKVVEALARMLPAAAAEGARGVQDAFDRNRPTFRYDVEANGDGGGTRTAGDDTPGFAGGSGGLRNFGAGTLAMLHGREAVLTEAQLRAMRAGGGGAVINFNNPVVREESDLTRLAAMVDAALSRRWSLTERVSWAGA